MKCRHCFSELSIPFANLGSAPPSNAYLSKQSVSAVEKWFPLNVKVCANCWLAQTEDYAGREELFAPDYAYFSSYSTSWLEHCQQYVNDMVNLLKLDSDSLVGEIASNDGYLLQYFQKKNVPCYGVEPTASTAKVAKEKGLTVFEEFFGKESAEILVEKGYAADLLIANNVLAHVPDINDFVSGFTGALKPDGVATFEFPHLYKLVAETQFDTIYHEHFSYLSLIAVNSIFETNGLQTFHVEKLTTHGGSLRVYAQRKDTGKRKASKDLHEMIQLETKAGMATPDFYNEFQAKITKVKSAFLAFLLDAQKKNQTVVAYGAAAKGNTLLNYSGIRGDLLSYVVDKNPAKQNTYLPGSHIPVVSEESLEKDKPDWIVILPWNLRDEITNQLSYVRSWGAKFVTAVPELTIF